MVCSAPFFYLKEVLCSLSKCLELTERIWVSKGAQEVYSLQNFNKQFFPEYCAHSELILFQVSDNGLKMINECLNQFILPYDNSL